MSAITLDRFMIGFALGVTTTLVVGYFIVESGLLFSILK